MLWSHAAAPPQNKNERCQSSNQHDGRTHPKQNRAALERRPIQHEVAIACRHVVDDLLVALTTLQHVTNLVAQIDRPDLKAQLLRDEAALAKAKAQLRDLEQGARSQELQEAAANLAAASAQATRAKADFERYSRLFREGAIATQQLDNSRSAHEVAANSLLAAQSRYSLLQSGNRAETIEAQRLEVARSEAVLAGSRSQLADTNILSPLSGRVLSKNYEQGECVNAGVSIATIGDMKDCWVKVFVSTTQMGQIRLGQAVKVKIDAYPDRAFRGEIREISQNAEYTPRQSITQRERANMVFAVKVKIDNPDEIMKPGLPADVVIE